MTGMTLTVVVDDLHALLRAWRAMAQMTLDEVAEKATELSGRPVNRQMVHRLEIGGRAKPDPVVLAAIARAVGRSADELPEEVIDELRTVKRLVNSGSSYASTLIAHRSWWRRHARSA